MKLRFDSMVTLTTHAQFRNNSTTLLRTHFEKANATFVGELKITSAIVLCIQKAPSEANRAFTNICDLNASNQNTTNCWAKFYSRLCCIISLIGTHRRIPATPLLFCIVLTKRPREVGY